ncbi:MAG: hypothetical protein WDN06_17850 [Asticcacaulis sp.]
MTESTFTFRVENDLKDAFNQSAKASDRSAAQLIRDFMRDYIRRQQDIAGHDAWFREQVQMGLDEADAGLLIPGEEVEAEFAARRAASLRKIGGSN